MASVKVYGSGTNMDLLAQQEKLRPLEQEAFQSLWIPSDSSPSFNGTKSIISFEDVHGGERTEIPYFQNVVKDEENGDEEEFDGCGHQAGKKRRLTVDQVLYLEKNFDMENKLEPERKVELAKDLGLQPRQVAIWFQNRRARFKNKQLEKDYNSLRSNYDALKADCDSLFKDNEKLKNEVQMLKDRLLLSDENSKLKAGHDPSFFLNTDSDNAITNQSMEVCKQEHSTSSAKSGAFDTDLSDVSQDDEDDPICNSFINFPKLEESDLSPNSCNFGFPTEDQPFWSLPY